MGCRARQETCYLSISWQLTAKCVPQCTCVLACIYYVLTWCVIFEVCNWFALTRPTAPQAGDCLDANEKCMEWAYFGECDKNPKYMHVSCRKACRLCRPRRLTTLDRMKSSFKRSAQISKWSLLLTLTKFVSTVAFYGRAVLWPGLHRMSTDDLGSR